jgi:hypothetical protein
MVGAGSFFSVEAAAGGAECPQPGETEAKANRRAVRRELLYRMITRRSSFDFVGFCDRGVVFCDAAPTPLILLQFIAFFDISIV